MENILPVEKNKFRQTNIIHIKAYHNVIWYLRFVDQNFLSFCICFGILCFNPKSLNCSLWNVNKKYANTHTHTHTHTHTPCISNMWSYLLVFCHTPTFIFSQFPYQIRPNKTLRILEIYSLFHIHKKHERASKSRWWFFSSRRYQNP